MQWDPGEHTIAAGQGGSSIPGHLKQPAGVLAPPIPPEGLCAPDHPGIPTAHPPPAAKPGSHHHPPAALASESIRQRRSQKE